MECLLRGAILFKGSKEKHPYRVQQAFNSLEVIRSRQGIGGPQPAETKRMLKEQRRDANAKAVWVRNERERLQHVSADLHHRFNALADG